MLEPNSGRFKARQIEFRAAPVEIIKCCDGKFWVMRLEPDGQAGTDETGSACYEDMFIHSKGLSA